MGRLTADPELKHTPSDLPVTSFTVAVERNYAKPGEQREADFIDVVAWRNTAEFISRYFQKGSMIAITGSLQTRTYTDKNGNKRKAVEVLAERAFFCGGKNERPTEKTATANDYDEIPGGDDDLPF